MMVEIVIVDKPDEKKVILSTNTHMVSVEEKSVLLSTLYSRRSTRRRSSFRGCRRRSQRPR